MSFSLAPPGKPSRILVRGTNWLGDTVMSLPAIKEIRRLFPSAHITLWVPASLAALWQVTEIADDIVSFDNNSGGPWRRPYRMRKRLVSKDFDLVVLFQNAFESAFTAWLARIPMRAGYPTDMRGLLLNIKVPLTQEIRSKHQVFYYLAITDFLAKVFQIPASPETRPADCSIPLREELLNGGKNELLSRCLDPELPLFCLCPGSVNSDAKRWPVDYFAELADLLIAHVSGQVVFLGTAQEHALIETIRSLMQNRGSVNLAGTADVVTAMAVMKLSTGVISNDTGSAHLAAAACAPVLTIFGPTSPGATAPYGPHSYTIQGEAPCAPCRHFRCPVPGQPCMRSVEPGTVFRKIQEITIPGT